MVYDDQPARSADRECERVNAQSIRASLEPQTESHAGQQAHAGRWAFCRLWGILHADWSGQHAVEKTRLRRIPPPTATAPVGFAAAHLHSPC